MELMLTVGISPGERTKGIVEREAEKRGTGREILKDLTQLILTDFYYVYRAEKKSGGSNCGIGCEVLPKVLVVLHQLTVCCIIFNLS